MEIMVAKSNQSVPRPASTGRTLPAFDVSMLKRVPDMGQRTTLVDKWILTRIKQAQDTSELISDKLESLSRAEGGIRSMIDSLRTGLSQVSPSIDQLNAAKFDAQSKAQGIMTSIQASVEPVEAHVNDLVKQTRDSADQILKEIPQELEPLIDLFKQRVEGKVGAAISSLDSHVSGVQVRVARQADELQKKVEREVDQQIEQSRERVQMQLAPLEQRAVQRVEDSIRDRHEEINDLLEQATSTTDRHALRVSSRISNDAKSAEHHVSNLIEESERRAMSVMQQIERRTIEAEQRLHAAEQRLSAIEGRVGRTIEQAQTQIESLAQMVDEDVKQTMEAAEKAIQAMANPVVEKIDLRITQLKSQLAGDILELETYFDQRLQAAQLELLDKASAFESRASQTLGQFDSLAAQTVLSASEKTQQILDDIATQAQALSEPAINQVCQAREQFAQAIADAGESMVASATQRVADIESAAAGVVESLDASLDRRLQQVERRGSTYVEAAVSRMTDESHTLVNEIVERFDSIRRDLPQWLTQYRQMEASIVEDCQKTLSESAARLELEANSMTQRLDQQIASRTRATLQASRTLLSRVMEAEPIYPSIDEHPASAT